MQYQYREQPTPAGMSCCASPKRQASREQKRPPAAETPLPSSASAFDPVFRPAEASAPAPAPAPAPTPAPASTPASARATAAPAAAESTLPTGWEAVVSVSSGDTYYRAVATGETTWVKPTSAAPTAATNPPIQEWTGWLVGYVEAKGSDSTGLATATTGLVSSACVTGTDGSPLETVPPCGSVLLARESHTPADDDELSIRAGDRVVVTVSDPSNAWVEKKSKSNGSTYYYNQLSGETAWEMPDAMRQTSVSTTEASPGPTLSGMKEKEARYAQLSLKIIKGTASPRESYDAEQLASEISGDASQAPAAAPKKKTVVPPQLPSSKSPTPAPSTSNSTAAPTLEAQKQARYLELSEKILVGTASPRDSYEAEQLAAEQEAAAAAVAPAAAAPKKTVVPPKLPVRARLLCCTPHISPNLCSAYPMH